MSRLTNRVKCNVPTIVLKMLGIEDVPTESVEIIKTDSNPCDSVCEQYEYECSQCPINEAFVKLAHYEDLEEQGRLIELLCAVGDMVWVITDCHNVITKFDWETGCAECPFEDECEFEDCSGNEDKLKIFKTSLEGYVTTKQGITLMLRNFATDAEMSDIGRCLFFTQEEAEAKLAEMEGAE